MFKALLDKILRRSTKPKMPPLVLRDDQVFPVFLRQFASDTLDPMLDDATVKYPLSSSDPDIAVVAGGCLIPTKRKYGTVYVMVTLPEGTFKIDRPVKVVRGGDDA